jgi:hypothetical protein
MQLDYHFIYLLCLCKFYFSPLCFKYYSDTMHFISRGNELFPDREIGNFLIIGHKFMHNWSMEYVCTNKQSNRINLDTSTLLWGGGGCLR